MLFTITPGNNTFSNDSIINFTANASSQSGVKNVTLWIFNTIGPYNSTTYTYAEEIVSVIVGIPILLIEGIYSWWFEMWNYANNFATTETTLGNYTLSVDLSYPWINFTDPTPGNGSLQSANSIFVNLSINGSAGIGTNVSTFIDFDNSLVGWWRMDDVNASGDPTDISGHCYDNETEILTENGWKLFKDLNEDEKVMTLNNETGEKE